MCENDEKLDPKFKTDLRPYLPICQSIQVLSIVNNLLEYEAAVPGHPCVCVL